jgi:exoribonuclease-2
LTLDTIEPHAVITNGVAVELQETVKGRARNLIENFMIVANTISARFSESHKQPVMRRVVVEPRRWDKIMEIAKEKGHTLPDSPDPIALEHFLAGQKTASPITFPDLSLTIIKLLGNGEYKVSFPGEPAIGHFGLSLRDYSHSTAPNRRFPDLITQRIIIATLTGQKLPYTNQELIKLAIQCTKKEDDAIKIERRMRKSAAAMVLSKSIGKVFSGIITGMSDKGTWVRVFSPPVDGKLIRGPKNLDIGDNVQVRLVHTDITAGFIDFESV